MCVYSIRMTDQERDAIKAYADMNGISMGTALKKAFFEMLEDQYDTKIADERYEEYTKDPDTLSADDINKKYGL